MSDSSSTGLAIPDEATLRAVTCPVQRAALVARVAKDRGTVPPWMCRVRIEALVEARWNGKKTLDELVAAGVGVGKSRISQLTSEPLDKLRAAAGLPRRGRRRSRQPVTI